MQLLAGRLMCPPLVAAGFNPAVVHGFVTAWYLKKPDPEKVLCVQEQTQPIDSISLVHCTPTRTAQHNTTTKIPPRPSPRLASFAILLRLST